MREVNKQELQKAIKQSVKPVFCQCWFNEMDLSGFDLQGINFRQSHFQNVLLNRSNFHNCQLENTVLDGCSLANANLSGANLTSASLRGCDLEGSNLCDANLYSAVLEKAKLNGVKTDKHTKWFRMYCPVKGPFVGFKRCFNNRIVQLLIPSDAKRSSATNRACRCNKAKVLKITNLDQTEEYNEAWSLYVDENFVYRRGHWVTVKNFNDDRWNESTTGIHFFMTRKEAIEF